MIPGRRAPGLLEGRRRVGGRCKSTGSAHPVTFRSGAKRMPPEGSWLYIFNR